jgi:hypothetical protein
VVIGNPPYIRIQALKEWAPLEVEFYKKRYASAAKGNYDIYVVFVEKGLSLLNRKGRLGYILPHKFFNAQYGEPLRSLISKGKHLAEVVHFGDQQVFSGATTYTCLMFLDKAGAEACKFEKVDNLDAWRAARLENVPNLEPAIPASIVGGIPTNTIGPAEWNFTVGKGSDLFQSMNKMSVKLGDVAEKIFQGLVTSCDQVYFLEPLGNEEGEFINVKSRQTGKIYNLESEIVRPLCKGSRDIHRYAAIPSRRILFPYDSKASAETGRTILIPEDEFQKRYSRCWEYLKENFIALRNREKGKMQHDGWYGYVYPKSVSLFSKPKILTPSIADRASFALDGKGTLYFVGSGGGGGGGYGIILKESKNITYEYLLGLLNSTLLDYFLKIISTRFRGGYFAYSRQYIDELPIRTVDFFDLADKARHGRMVTLVESMLLLHKQLAAANTDHEKTALQRQIDATDPQIDQLVYELYGLTDAEIAIVETANKAGQ